jgi:fucose permease
MMVGGSLGGMLGPALMGVLSSGIGVRKSFSISTIAVLIVLLLHHLSSRSKRLEQSGE